MKHLARMKNMLLGLMLVLSTGIFSIAAQGQDIPRQLSRQLQNPTLSTFGNDIPSLAYDFVRNGMNPTYGTEQITFARASAGSFYDSDGSLKQKGYNLLTYSEDFSNAAWAKNDASIGDTTTSPIGTTAQAFVENTANAAHSLAQAKTITAGATLTYSKYIKAGSGTRFIRVQVYSDGGASGFRLLFNPSTGTQALAGGAFGTGSYTGAVIQDAGNGWYRVSITGTVAAAATSATASVFQQNQAASYSAIYTGDGTSSTYFWGAQLTQSTAAQEYSKTTTAANSGPRIDYDPTSLKSQNLLTYSEQFDNAAWTKLGSSVTANQTTAPDGTLTADKLVESATTAVHVIQAVGAVGSNIYAAPVYLKAAERSFALISYDVSHSVGINLTTGAITETTGGATATVTSEGNGWWRVGMVATSLATRNFNIYASQDGILANRSYAGNGTSGIYVWGAQLSQSSSILPYTPTTSAASAAVFNAKGLLIEEARTNVIHSSADTSGWSTINLSQNGTITAPDGSAAPVWVGDATASSHRLIRSGSGGSAGNTDHAVSIFVNIPTGSDVARLYFRSRATSDGQSVGIDTSGTGANTTFTWAFSSPFGGTAPAIISEISSKYYGNGWHRLWYVTKLTTTTNVATQLDIAISNTTVENIGVTANTRAAFWQGQLEQGAFPTSPIITPAASHASREVDTASIGSLASWYTGGRSTLVAEYTLSGVHPTLTVQPVVCFDDGTASNRIWIYAATGTAPAKTTQAISSLAGVAQFSLTDSGVVADTLYRSVLGFSTNAAAFARNNSTPSTDTSVTLPTITSAGLGSSPALSTQRLGGWLRTFSYFPEKKSDSTIQVRSRIP